ncbi:MAG: RNA polymerase sigma factor [Gammaproteobacteria bacterium]
MECVGQQEVSISVSSIYRETKMQDTVFTDTDEQRLLSRIAESEDMRALEQLYTLYVPRLSQFLQRLTSDPQKIEEACNDVMMVVWKQAKNFNGNSKVSTWIFSIAYRICIKILRKSSWRPEIGGEVFEKLSETWVDDSSVVDENKDLVALALTRLSPKHRMVVELSYFMDRTYEEISEIISCPVNTVKTRMFHARRKLHDIVNEIS